MTSARADARRRPDVIGSGSGRLESLDGCDPVDCSIKRSDRLDTARLGAGDEIRLGEVDSIDLVDLKRAQEQRRIYDHDRREPDHRADQICDSLPLHCVEGLEDEDNLGDDACEPRPAGQSPLMSAGRSPTTSAVVGKRCGRNRRQPASRRSIRSVLTRQPPPRVAQAEYGTTVPGFGDCRAMAKASRPLTLASGGSGGTDPS